MLKVSADSDYTVNYTYGSDGQRAVKSSSAGETLYFNKMFSWSYNTSVYSNGARAVKHIYVNDQRIVTKMCKASDPTVSEMKEYEYFYHTDHLGSASLVTTGEGELYERIEYTPWGETWMDKTTASWETPYKFTGKEKDEETGLYYYGARYYDAKYSRWLSADPALGEYIPKASSNDKGNQNLPGQGGVFNHTNFNLFHYAGNNPVKYVDPDGRENKNIVSQFLMNSKVGVQYRFPQVILNDKDNTRIYEGGCAVTFVSNMLTSMGYNNSKPNNVNCSQFVSKGDINWKAVAKYTGYTLITGNSQFTFELWDSQENDENNKYYTAIRVQYRQNPNSPHWVGVNGTRIKNGNRYFVISETSVNDSNVGDGTIRNEQGWIKDDDGKILVPENKALEYRIYKAPIGE